MIREIRGEILRESIHELKNPLQRYEFYYNLRQKNGDGSVFVTAKAGYVENKSYLCSSKSRIINNS